MNKLLVRCHNRMVFEVTRDNYEPKTSSYYDAYCYSHPRRNVEYMDYFEWLKFTNDMRRSFMNNQRRI
jgi:hypothetical protein